MIKDRFHIVNWLYNLLFGRSERNLCRSRYPERIWLDREEVSKKLRDLRTGLIK